MNNNAVTKIHRDTPAPQTPARVAHEQILGELDREEQSLKVRITETLAVQTAAEVPGKVLAALTDRQAAAIAAQLVGDPATEDDAALQASITEQIATVTAKAPLLKGASIALDRLYAHRADIARRRAVELVKRRDIQLAEIDDMRAANDAALVATAGPMATLLAERRALDEIRDRIRRQGEALTANYPQTQVQMPTAVSRVFVGVTVEAIERRGQEIMSQIGVKLNANGEAV